MACKRPIPAALSAGLLLVATAVWAREPAAEKPDQQQSYIRLVRDKSDQPTVLDTAIVRFAGQGGATVDLVAAVHIADGKYYDELNRRFPTYDVVLYELVAPAGTTIPEGKPVPTNNPISFVQKMLRDVLQLEFQFERVHYGRPNMVHADMSPEELAAAMQRRGESVLSIILHMMLQSMAQQDQTSGTEVQLLLALLNPNRALALKRVMSEQFQAIEGRSPRLAARTGLRSSRAATRWRWSRSAASWPPARRRSPSFTAAGTWGRHGKAPPQGLRHDPGEDPMADRLDMRDRASRRRSLRPQSSSPAMCWISPTIAARCWLSTARPAAALLARPW